VKTGESSTSTSGTGLRRALGWTEGRGLDWRERCSMEEERERDRCGGFVVSSFVSTFAAALIDADAECWGRKDDTVAEDDDRLDTTGRFNFDCCIVTSEPAKRPTTPSQKPCYERRRGLIGARIVGRDVARRPLLAHVLRGLAALMDLSSNPCPPRKSSRRARMESTSRCARKSSLRVLVHLDARASRRARRKIFGLYHSLRSR
jgi:hypothetical protein